MKLPWVLCLLPEDVPLIQSNYMGIRKENVLQGAGKSAKTHSKPRIHGGSANKYLGLSLDAMRGISSFFQVLP